MLLSWEGEHKLIMGIRLVGFDVGGVDREEGVGGLDWELDVGGLS